MPADLLGQVADLALDPAPLEPVAEARPAESPAMRAFLRVDQVLRIGDGVTVRVLDFGHKGDLTCLRWALQTPAHYIGMIGSKRKVSEISKVLESEGVPAEKLERAHSPIGLEIGALTPEEIAVSIVAEMIAVRRNAVPSVPAMTYKRKAQPAPE
jgi:xanthine/CO dehydrogenase XdhC/CoxF family maturation factor